MIVETAIKIKVLVIGTGIELFVSEVRNRRKMTGGGDYESL